MPNSKTDQGGFSTSNADQERDLGAKGGPSTSLGRSDDQHGISAPYDSDLTTQMAVKSKHKKDEKKDQQPDNKSSL